MEFCIAPDHPSLPGHFPGRPIVPGVLLLEQVLIAIETAHGALGPMRLPQVKFLRPLLPGEPARVELLSTDDRRWTFRVLRDDAVLATGEVVGAGVESASTQPTRADA